MSLIAISLTLIVAIVAVSSTVAMTRRWLLPLSDHVTELLHIPAVIVVSLAIVGLNVAMGATALILCDFLWKIY